MKRVGRHTIVRELASSGALATFEATHEDGRTVRLRVLDRAVDLGEVGGGRFADDLSRVAALRHPGIDRPIAWSAKPPVHVSTVRLAGVSLREVCDDASVGRVAPAVAAGVGADVAEALHAAHSAGLVHAGVSADSILLGTDGRARVTDFGVMRCLSELASTEPQVLRGSIESLSPEQLDTPEKVGPHTDVFGVGLALYRAMTGKPAFDAPSALGMSIRLSMGKPTPIEAHGIEIPDELRRIVMKMLSASPTDRPPMDVVARTLETLAGSWRDSVRRLAAPRAISAETATDSPPPQQALPSEPAPPGETPPREEARPTADPDDGRERTPLTTFDPPFPTVVSPITSDWASGDEAPLDDAMSAPFDVATRLEITLPTEEATDDYATLFELQAPVGPSDGSDLDDELDAAPISRGDTSPWSTTDEQSGSVPKTVILEAPRARTPAVPAPRVASSRSLSTDPFVPEDSTPSEAIARAPGWAMWAAIALGAMALLIGTAALVILITG